MTLDEVKAWIAPFAKVMQDIQAELILIEQLEKSKHKHFTEEGAINVLSKLPDELRNIVITKVHEIADSRNIMLKPGDYTSAKFTAIYREMAMESLNSVRNSKVWKQLPEEAQFDKDGRCPHDIDCDNKIGDALEFITIIINKFECKP